MVGPLSAHKPRPCSPPPLTQRRWVGLGVLQQGPRGRQRHRQGGGCASKKGQEVKSGGRRGGGGGCERGPREEEVQNGGGMEEGW